jgi:hypothetical protein
MPLKPKISKRPKGIVRAQKLAGKFLKATNPTGAKAVKTRARKMADLDKELSKKRKRKKKEK